MGVKYDREKWFRLKGKIENLFADWHEDLREIGEVARDEIVRATLAGIGEADQPFKPYSPAYRDLIEAVGGKPGGVVNLRGVFYHDNSAAIRKFTNLPAKLRTRKISARQRRMGAGRRAYVRISIGGREFIARTKQTRPQTGLLDKESEMSVDLIAVEALPGTDRVKLIYTPRREPYMIYHNETRKWFTLNRENVRAAAIETMKTLLASRIESVKRMI